MRKIIHIDMDAFYASIEQRDNPSLKGKPVAVGGSGKRGVVATASYEARKYSVYSAMPSVTAIKKCPDLIFVTPRFDVYREVSRQIREIFLEYTDLVEPLSLDEAYLDVTENKRKMDTATEIAGEIKKRIRDKTKLTASAGVSINKFLAKMASEQNKPDGLFVITPKKALPFVAQLPIEKFHGIGKVTASKMQQMGIHNGGDLKKLEERELIRHFGKVGHYYYQIARAVDERPVDPNRIRKSIGAERTFEEDITEEETIIEQVTRMADILFDRVRKSNASGKTITLKVKFADFETVTRSKTLSHDIHEKAEILHIGLELTEKIVPTPKGIRLLGLTLSNLTSEKSEPHISDLQPSRQLTLEF